MQVRVGVVHLVAEASPDGRTASARRSLVVDAEIGAREQVWPEVSRPMLPVPLKSGSEYWS